MLSINQKIYDSNINSSFSFINSTTDNIINSNKVYYFKNEECEKIYIGYESDANIYNSQYIGNEFELFFIRKKPDYTVIYKCNDNNKLEKIEDRIILKEIDIPQDLEGFTDIIKGNNIIQFGIQGTPGDWFIINNEPIMIGELGFYEYKINDKKIKNIEMYPIKIHKQMYFDYYTEE